MGKVSSRFTEEMVLGDRAAPAAATSARTAASVLGSVRGVTGGDEHYTSLWLAQGAHPKRCARRSRRARRTCWRGGPRSART